MRGFIVRQHGGIDALKFEELQDPKPGPGEVLVKVLAVGCNHLDVWVRKGVPGHKFPLPLIPGSDIVGKVAAVGPSTQKMNSEQLFIVSPGFSCGGCSYCLRGQQQLCKDYGIFGESRDGGYAEFVTVPAVNLLPAPANLSPVELASMPLTFLTAWHMLVSRAGVGPGMRVLIQAGASGVGSAAIQIAKLFGANVIATASSEEKLKFCRSLGADFTFNYRTGDLVTFVKEITHRKGVDIVVEHVGQATFGLSLRSLKKGGTLVFCGATSGAQVKLDLRPVFFKSLSILGSTMGTLGEMTQIIELVAQGKLKPTLTTTLPLEQAPKAHEMLEKRNVTGKIVLKVA